MMSNLCNALKHQWLLFLLSLSFFTRVPINLSTEIKPEMLHDASRYFALVGLFIGGVLSLVFLGLSLLLPIEIAILLTMAGNIV